jgi:hypothetical protein
LKSRAGQEKEKREGLSLGSSCSAADAVSLSSCTHLGLLRRIGAEEPLGGRIREGARGGEVRSEAASGKKEREREMAT